MDAYTDEVERGAVWLGEWIRLHVLERWPTADLTYEGAAVSGSRYWSVRLPNGTTAEIGATEPTLLEPGVRDIPISLDTIDWRGSLLEVYPAGLLISTGGRLFEWDRERDRGTRLIAGM